MRRYDWTQNLVSEHNADTSAHEDLLRTDGSRPVTGDLTVDGDIIYGSQPQGPIPTTSTPAGTTQTIDWNDGPVQILDLEDATGDVTVTLSNPIAGNSYILKVIQDSAVARDIIWPGTVVWVDGIVPTVSVGADAEDVFGFLYVGSTYYGTVSQNNS